MKRQARVGGLAVAISMLASGCIMVDLSSLGTRELEEVTVEKAAGWHADKVLLVDISGEIAEGGDGGLFGGFVCSPHYLRAVLKKAEEDRAIRAVVLRIDSPGGTVGASERLAREVAEFKKRTGRPVYANITGLGCSGAYYLAAACDRIDAQPSAIVGSIGVIAVLPKLQKLADKVGYDQEIIKSGAMKDMGNMFRDMTDEERRVFLGLIEADYAAFLNWIVTQRPQVGGSDRLRPQADGRVFTAAQALQGKLIDSVGFLDETIDAAKEKAGIRSANVVTYAYEQSRDANLYSPAGSARAPGVVNLQLPTSLRLHSGLYYLWLPGN